MRHRDPRRLLALAAAVAIVILMLPGTALANHGGSDIQAGRDWDGTQSNFFHVANKTMYVGQTVTVSFVIGSHNVGIDTGSLPAGAAAFRSGQFATQSAETVGSSFTYTLTAPGTYNYYCSVHASQGDSTGASYDANGHPTNNKMVGRIVVATDASGPSWGAGSANANAVSASQIDLTWPAATDAETGIKEYRVYEATGATRPAKPATAVVTVNSPSPPATSLSRTGLTAGQHYWYWITAVNGAGTASSTDQLADATTTSVSASAQASGVVKFAVNPTLAISVTPAVVDLGTVSPAAAATGAQTVNVKSNDLWSLSVKSIGRNGVDDNPGDDAVFTGAGGQTIPIGRLTWRVGGGAWTPYSDSAATLLTGQAATASTGTDTTVDISLLVQYSDPVAVDYQAVLLYTVTQP